MLDREAAVPKGNSNRLEAYQIYRILLIMSCIYLTMSMFLLPALWAFNDTHIYNWGGHNNGHLLKTVVCQSGKICVPKQHIELNCRDWLRCRFPCEDAFKCQLIKPLMGICVRYECTEVNIYLQDSKHYITASLIYVYALFSATTIYCTSNHDHYYDSWHY